MKLVERIGSGVRRIRDTCPEHGVAEPGIQVSTDWVTVTFPRREVAIAPHVTPHEAPHLTPHVRRLVAALQGETGRAELMATLGVSGPESFPQNLLNPSSELNQSRQGSQMLVREMERKLLRFPGEGKQTGDGIDGKIYRVSVIGYVQSVPYFRVGRRWSPWRSPPSAPER